ncbi:flippase [Dankookia sp. P2]|uniref:flippase n=1 Tax=Dankookia sp. P2 TaxID=3423955 RepID=UPI003D67F737
MDQPEARTRARALLTGIAWNAAGRGLPLILALVLTPFLVHQLGLERWGLFTLALALVGVFGVFDFGVGQALTRALSERIGQGRGEEAAGLVGAALACLGGLSLAVAAGLWLGVPLLVERVLNVPAALQPQAIAAMRVLAAAAPLVVLNAALWGVLAAYQRFRAANLATIPVNIFYYLGPVLVLLVWDDLMAVMLTLVAVRLANTLSYLFLLRGLVRRVLATPLRLRLVLPLLRLGGWMTFSGLLVQALLYADRFLIGALLSLAAVAWYATPLDLVLRVWMVPVAVSQTLLPAFASAYATLPQQTVALLRRGSLLVMGLVLPIALVLAGAGDRILGLWLGPDFAAGGGLVLRILGVGIYFSCLAYVPGALIDAIGRPDPDGALRAAPGRGLPAARGADGGLAGDRGRRHRLDAALPGRLPRQALARRPALSAGAGWRHPAAARPVCGGHRPGADAGHRLASGPAGGRDAGTGQLRRVGLPFARPRRARPDPRWPAASGRAAASRWGRLMALAINGRFLGQRVTGVQRFATEICRELDALAGAYRLADARLLRPAGGPPSPFGNLAEEASPCCVARPGNNPSCRCAPAAAPWSTWATRRRSPPGGTSWW